MERYISKIVNGHGSRNFQVQILLNTEESSCDWCSTPLKKGFGIHLLDCFHLFCLECLESTIKENNTSGEIRCPFFADTIKKCNGLLRDKEIKQILSNEDYEKFTSRLIEMALGKNSNLFHCKTNGCRGICEIGEGSKIFLCNVCEKSNCITCQDIHENIDCKTYQKILKTPGINRDEILELVKKEGYKNGFNQLLGIVNSKSKKTQKIEIAEILQTMESHGFFPTFNIFECLICDSEINEGEGVILECTHMFCKECLIGVIDNAGDPTIKCPYIDANFSCTSILEPRLIRGLVPKAVYEKLERASIKQAEGAIANSFHCKTPDCSGWCEVENEVAPGTIEHPSLFYTCEICKKKNCLICKVIHENVSCEDYKNRLVQNQNDEISKAALAESIRNGECMHCPTCKVIVTKISGCDAIVCFVCKTDICWATKGLRWGPRGKGDYSGGCKCRQNGRLCVANCQNCH